MKYVYIGDIHILATFYLFGIKRRVPKIKPVGPTPDMEKHPSSASGNFLRLWWKYFQMAPAVL